MSDSVIIASLVCFTVIFLFLAYWWFRFRLEQHKTFQTMLQHAENPELLIQDRLKASGNTADLRRGVLLLVLGISMTAIFYVIGGKAWVLGFVPMGIGLVYLAFWKRNARH